MKRYALRDDQWRQIEQRLPGRKGCTGQPAKNNRLFVEAFLYRYRAGFHGEIWFMEKRSQAVEPLGKKWCWEKNFQTALGKSRYEYGMIDSTIVRAHQHSAGAIKCV